MIGGFVLGCSEQGLAPVDDSTLLPGPSVDARWSQPAYGSFGWWYEWAVTNVPFAADQVLVYEQDFTAFPVDTVETLSRVDAASGEVLARRSTRGAWRHLEIPPLVGGGAVALGGIEADAWEYRTTIWDWTSLDLRFEVSGTRPLDIEPGGVLVHGVDSQGTEMSTAFVSDAQETLWTTPPGTPYVTTSWVLSAPVEGDLQVSSRATGQVVGTIPGASLLRCGLGFGLEMGPVVIAGRCGIDVEERRLLWVREDLRCLSVPTEDGAGLLNPSPWRADGFTVQVLDPTTGVTAHEFDLRLPLSDEEAVLCPTVGVGEGLWVFNLDAMVVFVDAGEGAIAGVYPLPSRVGFGVPFVRRLSTGELFVGVPKWDEYLGFVFEDR